MTTRRTFIATLAGGFLAAPLPAEAQQAAKVYRVGVVLEGGDRKSTRLNSSHRL